MRAKCFLLFISLGIYGCAKKIEGAGSASVPLSASETVQVIPAELPPAQTPQIGPIAPEAEQEEGFKIGLGFSNLRPYIVGLYYTGDLAVGVGLGGIIFSGMKISYNAITGDISVISKQFQGKRSFVGLGGGAGGFYATDDNWVREGRKTYMSELHAYGQMHISWKPAGTDIGMSLNFKLGGFYVKSPVLIDIAEELAEKGEEVRKRKSISGLLFIPSFGFNWTMAGGKVWGYAGLTLPLSTFLIFEPDFHPYVPSLNFVFLF